MFEPVIQLFSYLYLLITGAIGAIFNTKNFDTVIKYSKTLIFVAFSCAVVYYASTDPRALTDKTYLYIFLAAVPLIAAMSLSLPIYNTSGSSMYSGFIAALVVLCLSSAFYFVSSMDLTTAMALSILINLLLFLIIVMGMAIFFIIFSNYLKSLTGIQGFIVYLIFYIPCLFVDFFRYLLKEYNSTTNDVYILFVLEILFVLLYIYIPKLLQKISSQNGIVLLENSVFLDIPYSLDTNAIAIKPSADPLSQQTTIGFRKNYAISLWTYLNSESTSNSAYSNESLIFSYGNGKPMITYYNQIDDADPTNTKPMYVNSDKYIVYFTDVNGSGKNDNTRKISLPSQKWNNLVFNYYSDHADLFINGHLELTFPFDNNNMPIYLPGDDITIGSQNGLNGAVCNVRYYTAPLSQSKIIMMYNLLMNNNPPTFT
jgi:hypothetical protein